MGYNYDVKIKIVKPAKMSSVFEENADLAKNTNKGVVATICVEASSKLITESNSFQQALPELKLLSPCPVMTEIDGSLTTITGYNKHTGIYASGVEPEEMELEKAVECILTILDEFDFVSEGDRARAIASVITPALVAGRLLGGRAPIDLGEADQSQAGKGYRFKIILAIYNSKPKTVTQKKGGVGSMEESFNTALVGGSFFIILDNFRGKVDSPALESFLTEESYSARIPHQAAMEIDPTNFILMMTSNKADFTIDLANRASTTRIRKKPDGYQFKRYPEGNVVDHVKANQPLYLGAVFTIIRAWFDAGKPRTDETRHDFREWVQTLDWICQNYFKTCPIMDGHRETQARITNPALNWLRDVALIITRERPNTWLKASDILNYIEFEDVEIPGLKMDQEVDESNRLSIWMAIGRKISQCFKGQDKVETDGMVIIHDSSYSSEYRKEQNSYSFALATDCNPTEVSEERVVMDDCGDIGCDHVELVEDNELDCFI